MVPMEISDYFAIVRRRWPLVLALPLAVALISLGLALGQAPVYGATARLLAHRAAALEPRPAPPGPTASLMEAVKLADTVTDDLPAVVRGAPLARDVAAELARRGRTLDPASVQKGLGAEIDQRTVLLTASAADPADALAMLQAALDLLQANGLRYWGVTDLAPRDSGITLVVLDMPAAATRTNGLRPIALAVGLRSLSGLVAALALVFLLHLAETRRAARPAPAGERPPQRNPS